MKQNIHKGRLADTIASCLELPGRILLVTGKGSYAGSGAEDALSRALGDCEVERFSDFQSNPKLEDVRRGIQLQERFKADAIVGVGGGSAMDMAKLIKGLSFQQNDVAGYVTGKEPLSIKNESRLVAIPTTSGSGSESTRFAVVYKDKIKYSLSHPGLIPEHVLLDYRLTCSMSPYQTACSGFDALAQAIEAHWAVNATKESDEFARKAIALAWENLEGAVKDPSDSNKAAMQDAAHFAGQAINLTTTTAPHAFSYYLTSHFDIPHGHAVALLLGAFIIYNDRVSKDDVSGAEIAPEEVRRRIKTICSLLGADDAQDAHSRIAQRMDTCGLESCLGKMMDFESDFDSFYAGVNLERVRNNPRQPTAKQELRSLLKEEILLS